MTSQTIHRLNQLNQRFYEQVATDFSQTREQPWNGWQQLVPLLQQKQPQNILDVGCGNGRFAEFLQQHLSDFQYHGIDNNEKLLRIAKSHLPNANFSQIDIVESLSESSLNKKIAEKYNLITFFGVLHHIPSFELRKKLLEFARQHITQNGLVIFTTWQFDCSPKLLKRQIDPTTLHFSREDLEPNDYFLTWERGAHAIRYCHLINAEEQKKLIEGWHLVQEFEADGETTNLNHYVILSPNFAR